MMMTTKTLVAKWRKKKRIECFDDKIKCANIIYTNIYTYNV